jgi:hypothetical protein
VPAIVNGTFTVAWHRHKGRRGWRWGAVRDPIYEVPTAIDDVTRAEAVTAIDALTSRPVRLCRASTRCATRWRRR